MSNHGYSGEFQPCPELPASQGSLDMFAFSDTEIERMARDVNGHISSSDG